MNPDEVISEFIKLVESGYKEIILTGVNVGDYGKSFNTDLFHLLLRLIDVPGEFRIRISSIEPNLLSDEIIELTASSDKMCKHFHIPLQSGSSNILKLMQRRYKVHDYEKLIYKLRKRIPDVGIGVDVIVGFPGESEVDFLETYNFLRDLPISYLHVFTYSERPNTKAINLENPVNVFERRKRNNMLRILSEKKKLAFYNEMINKEAEVLFEAENDNGLTKGFTSNYIKVSHQYNPDLINQISKVTITKVEGDICLCESKETKKAIDLIAC